MALPAEARGWQAARRDHGLAGAYHLQSVSRCQAADDMHRTIRALVLSRPVIHAGYPSLLGMPVRKPGIGIVVLRFTDSRLSVTGPHCP